MSEKGGSQGYERPQDTPPCTRKFCSDNFRHPYSYAAWPWVSPYLFPTCLSSLAAENHAEISHAAESRAPFPRTASKEAPSLAISWWQQAACHVPHPTSPRQWPRARWRRGRVWGTAVPWGAGDPQHPSAPDASQVPLLIPEQV